MFSSFSFIFKRNCFSGGVVLFEECFGINISEFIRENIFEKLGIKEYEWGNYGKYCMSATGLYLKHTNNKEIYDSENQYAFATLVLSKCVEGAGTSTYYSIY